MTQTEHKALVARYFEQVLTHGDVAALDDLLAPDFRSWLPDGTSVGPGPYRDAVLASRRAFPDLPVTITAIHLHRVAGGRLAEHWEAINLLPLLRQLGAIG